LYSQPSLLFLNDGDKLVDTILSQEGVRQGDVLGPLLFCIGIHRLYVDCLRESGAQGVAIADDFTLVGLPDQVLVAVTWLLDNSDKYTGLHISPSKSEIFYPRPHQQPCDQAIRKSFQHVVQSIQTLAQTHTSISKVARCRTRLPHCQKRKKWHQHHKHVKIRNNYTLNRASAKPI
jgi:hypothetical protein